jgi:hypothetical protein
MTTKPYSDAVTVPVEADAQSKRHRWQTLLALVALIAATLADRLGLTHALLWTIPFPWAICGLVYSLFYWAYPRDAAKLRSQMAGRARILREGE